MTSGYPQFTFLSFPRYLFIDELCTCCSNPDSKLSHKIPTRRAGHCTWEALGWKALGAMEEAGVDHGFVRMTDPANMIALVAE
ncbi:hypothetical protein E2C01_041416 [Portunus trituberculatus]|uniref:Uncharacterized protein n=1 Tax=Portunus trituberculatus TaxID=210409 RepID=A0A5B7FTI6_PORTR|nr:hypothetical protein [Portunus trituberculatus]